MPDPPHYPGTGDDSRAGTGASAGPGNQPTAGRSRWRLVTVWVIGIALILLILVLHLTGTLGAGTNG
jgi:hypothetical protein